MARRTHSATLRKGERRRLLLLDSAEELLATRTVGELTLEEVAGKAGLSRSGVYFYFDDKLDLVDALIQRGNQRILDEFTTRLEADQGSWEGAIGAAVASALSGWREHRAVFLAAVERASHADRGTDVWRQIMGDFAAQVDQLQAQFDLPAVDPVGGDLRLAIEMAIFMTERNFYMLFSRDHTPEEEARMAAAIEQTCLRMIGVPGA